MNSNPNIDKYPDNKVHGANMGPIWGRQEPDGPMLAPWTLLSGITCPVKCGIKLLMNPQTSAAAPLKFGKKGAYFLVRNRIWM